MAELVPKDEVVGKTKGVEPKYDWHKWSSDLGWWKAIAGEDYTITDVNFAKAVRSWAINHDRKAQARIHRDGGSVFFRFSNKHGEFIDDMRDYLSKIDDRHYAHPDMSRNGPIVILDDHVHHYAHPEVHELPHRWEGSE